MTLVRFLVLFLTAGYAVGAQTQFATRSAGKRLVILKVDGLNADLLSEVVRQVDPATGKSRLPWISHIFMENGTVFQNFYTRGISLSAPSWSMLDTGQHLIIRGNVEYDRYTGYVYDYLNFFPFYLGYARSRSVDMPGVEVLDRAGIPLLLDTFAYPEGFQSFQLFQRGVRWKTLQHALQRRFSTKALWSMIEEAGGPSLDESLAQQTEQELRIGIAQPEVLYLDDYTGDIDHEGHASNQRAALEEHLINLDKLAGRIWTGIQASPMAASTVFALVSDHGMNNVPGVYSQGFSLPDLFNSAAGGAHHVITNRHQLSEYKLSGLNPLVSRVNNASTASFYLKDQADHYPTAWLDVDGNERASVHLRNSDLNKIHILLLQLAKPDLPVALRRAAASAVRAAIEHNRAVWTRNANDLDEETGALAIAIGDLKDKLKRMPKLRTDEQHDLGLDKEQRRLTVKLADWQREHAEYTAYVAHLRALLALQPDPVHPFQERISNFIPEMALGENNTVAELAHYVAGPGPSGLVTDSNGDLDEERSFRFVNYFALLASQRVRNNPQPALSTQPIDFTALRAAPGMFWLCGDEDHQLLVQAGAEGKISLEPVRRLTQDSQGKLHWERVEWRAGLPLHLFEDPRLLIPAGHGRADWLSGWHTEREWMDAIHLCRYSNGVVGITEQLAPVGSRVPGQAGAGPILTRYEKHRRELVQPDFEVFAADHWNFNVRNFNPGGNHGGFFRISTHSVWMLSGAGVPAGKQIEEPYDSLNFASTVAALIGHTPPARDKVVPLN